MYFIFVEHNYFFNLFQHIRQFRIVMRFLIVSIQLIIIVVALIVFYFTIFKILTDLTLVGIMIIIFKMYLKLFCSQLTIYRISLTPVFRKQN